MIDFICLGLIDLFEKRTDNYKNKNSGPKWDSSPGPSAYEANLLSVEQLELINIDPVKVTAFYLSFLCKLPVQRAHLVLPVFISLEILLCIFSYNICIVLLFDLF